MKKLLRSVGPECKAISPKTWDLRFTDMRIRESLSTTQGWTFVGGDALVCVAGHGSEFRGYTVLRIGKVVKVYEGSVRDAMNAAGLGYDNYRITGPAKPRAPKVAS